MISKNKKMYVIELAEILVQFGIKAKANNVDVFYSTVSQELRIEQDE